MSLGAHRGLVDLYCFALYNTALTEYHHQQQITGARTVPGSTNRRLQRAGHAG
jgi:hypothetical protein